MIYTVADVIGAGGVENIKVNIQTIIEQESSSQRLADAQTGVNYYKNKTDILNAQQTYVDSEGNTQNDPTKANNKIRHAFYPLLVKQKTGYLVGKPMNFMCQDEATSDYLKRVLGEKWNSTVQTLCTNASNKGEEWLYCYIDHEGKFDYVVCPMEQIIPLYDNGFKTRLEGVIRHYTTTTLGGEVVKHVEFWTLEKVMYFDGEDLTYTGEKAHFYINEVGYTFGILPFVQFKNNEDMTTDLSLVKDLIDNYDKVVSGLANDLDDIQDAILVLKGYQGTDPEEFNKNLRYFKLIKVDEAGGVSKLEVNIPIAAKDSHLKRLEDDIYRMGMGVDVSAEKLGNSSGVALKFIYSLLDLKCDQMETQFKKGIKHLLGLIFMWRATIEGVETDREGVKYVFNRSFIINTKEMITNVVNSNRLVSAKTMLANHPFVTDVEFELAQMKAEGITPLWEETGEAPETDQSMTSGGYENTGENTTD